MGIENAIPNPLAREIVDAVQLLGLKTVFEPGKMHPKDWSNPGRVRVGLKEQESGGRGKVKNSMVRLENSRSLLTSIYGAILRDSRWLCVV